MRYEGIVYRPPSEADSLILQTTIGCPHNKCGFCIMYRDKRFRIRKVSEIIEDINAGAEMFGPYQVHSVFLADGNSVIMRPSQLVEILDHLYATFPNLRRVTTYGATQYLAAKKPQDMKALAKAGLTRVHCGMESGDDEVLAYIQKGATADIQIRGGLNVREAGMEVSFYVMPGLGGVERSEQHALGSARVLSAVKPDFIRLRTFLPQQGTQMAEACKAGGYTLLSPHQTLAEIRLMLENLDAEGSTVVSDHWINFAPVEGRLAHDKPKMLEAIDKALQIPEERYRRVGIYNGTL